jgi:ribokinase
MGAKLQYRDATQGRVIVAGSINMDVVVATARYPAPGETIAGSSIAFYPGGKGANLAVAARRLGRETILIGRTGRDVFGADLMAFLTIEQVNLTHVHPCDAATGAAIITTVNAANTIIVVPGANALVDAAAGTALAVHAADVLVSPLEIPQDTIRAFFRHGKLAGARTILNPSPAAIIDPGLLADTDFLVLNETELAWLTGQRLDVAAPDAAVAAAARKIRAQAFQVVCVTLGWRGCLAVAGETVITVPGREVQAIDSTGAGDCFTGALAAYLATHPAGDGCLEAALHAANDAACLSVQRAGAGPSMPTATELAAFQGRI